MQRVLLLVFVSLLSAADAGLGDFMKAFSSNFARHNTGALLEANQVRLPLVLKGTLDDSPELCINRKRLHEVLPKIAQQPSGLNLQNLNETEAEHLQAELRAGRLPADAGERTVRSGNLVFARAKKTGGWQLVKVYVGDDLVAELSGK